MKPEPGRCPTCQSTNTIKDASGRNNQDYYETCLCQDCYTEWTNEYKFTKKTKMMIKPKPSNDVCPVCQWEGIIGDSIKIDGKFAYQKCECTCCSSVWTEKYKFNNHIDVEDNS